LGSPDTKTLDPARRARRHGHAARGNLERAAASLQPDALPA